MPVLRAIGVTAHDAFNPCTESIECFRAAQHRDVMSETAKTIKILDNIVFKATPEPCGGFVLAILKSFKQKLRSKNIRRGSWHIIVPPETECPHGINRTFGGQADFDCE